jgi:plastocyanin
MFKARYLAGSVVLALLISACGAGTSSPTQQASTEPSASTTARVVQVEIGDGYIDPASITVQQGETITFEVTNANTEEVELIVGLKTDVDADSGDSLKEAEHIAVNGTGTVTYTFDGAGPWAYGDQFGDHYSKGAKGDIVIGS